MKLKCIGGEHNGFTLDVEDLMRVGNYVRVLKSPKEVSTDLSKISQGAFPDYVVMKELIYRIEEIKFVVDGQIDGFKFLVTHYPAHMTFEQALKYQFTK